MEFVKLFGPTLVGGLLAWLGIYIKARLDDRAVSRAAEVRKEAGVARIETIRLWLEVREMAAKTGAEVQLPPTMGGDLLVAYAEAKRSVDEASVERTHVWASVAALLGPPRTVSGFWGHLWAGLYWVQIGFGALILLALIATVWDSTFDPARSWLFNFTTAVAASAVIILVFILLPLGILRRLALFAKGRVSAQTR